MQLVYHRHALPAILLNQKTLGNSTKSVSFRDAWLATASRPEIVEHRFVVDPNDAETVSMAKQFLHDLGAALRPDRAMIVINVEDGMVPPHSWDDKVVASGDIVIDASNIERILGGAK
jgi:sulfur carrier protein ThiS